MWVGGQGGEVKMAGGGEMLEVEVQESWRSGGKEGL